MDAFDEELNTTFSKDDRNILLRDGEFYHPVALCVYGIACHQAFLDTKDSSYYKNMVDQVKYFQDSSLWDVHFDGKGIGLPYHMDFHDLKAPWYSGMAQGLSLSFLLRYRELTGDTSLDQTMKRIVYFMIQPEKSGGTISNINTEPWIELYPNSLTARHVLNGSLNGFIGLYEYSTVFEIDKSVSDLLLQCYSVYKNRLPLFTDNGWARYDLGTRYCNPIYMRYQIYEVKQMYELFGDDDFRRQTLLWAALLNGKAYDDGLNTLKSYDHHISKMAEPGPGGWQFVSFTDSIEKVKIKSQHAFKDFSLLNKRLGITEQNGIKKSNAETQFILFEFGKKELFQYLQLSYQGSAQELNIRLYSKIGQDLVELSTIKHQLSDSFWHGEITQNAPPEGYENLIVELEGKDAQTVEQILPSFYDTSDVELPWFGHYQTENMYLEKGKTYNFTLDNYQVKYLKIFYKFDKDASQADFADYSPYNILNSTSFSPKETGFYKFLVSYERENLISIVDMLRYTLAK